MPKLPTIPLGAKLSESRLSDLSLGALQLLENDLWNLLEAYEGKIKKSKQAGVKLGHDLDRIKTKELIQQIKAELHRRETNPDKPAQGAES